MEKDRHIHYFFRLPLATRLLVDGCTPKVVQLNCSDGPTGAIVSGFDPKADPEVTNG